MQGVASVLLLQAAWRFGGAWLMQCGECGWRFHIARVRAAVCAVCIREGSCLLQHKNLRGMLCTLAALC
jgi:hypothetical protein